MKLLLQALAFLLLSSSMIAGNDTLPNPNIKCISNAETVCFEWEEEANINYEPILSQLCRNLEAQLVASNKLVVSGLDSPCQFAIFGLVVSNDQPSSCPSESFTSLCRPSPKPTFLFQIDTTLVLNTCDAFDLIDLVAIINGEPNPITGEWLFTLKTIL